MTFLRSFGLLKLKKKQTSKQSLRQFRQFYLQNRLAVALEVFVSSEGLHKNKLNLFSFLYQMFFLQLRGYNPVCRGYASWAGNSAAMPGCRLCNIRITALHQIWCCSRFKNNIIQQDNFHLRTLQNIWCSLCMQI